MIGSYVCYNFLFIDKDKLVQRASIKKVTFIYIYFGNFSYFYSYFCSYSRLAEYIYRSKFIKNYLTNSKIFYPF